MRFSHTFSLNDPLRSAGALFIAVCLNSAQASTWQEKAELAASDHAAYDLFGMEVSISGPVAVVGAPDHAHYGPLAGSAYVFRLNGSQWVQDQELASLDIFNFASFGSAVAVAGDFIVIGAPGDTENGSSAGAAYIFRDNGSSWIQEDKLLPSDGVAFNEIGSAVAISGFVAVVGAELDDELGTSSGAAYVFRRVGTTWVEEDKLLASDGGAGDKFGISVGISGNVVIAGAWGDDDKGSSAGAAYIFRHNGSIWVQEAKLLAADGGASDFFGGVVAASANKVLIGSTGDDDRGTNAGAAYVFRHTGSAWVQEQKLLAADGVAADTFGSAVAIEADTAVLGATGDDDNGASSGSAYVFHFNGSTWTQEDKILSADGAASDTFGGSVGVSAGTIISGAWSDDDHGNNAGSAYIFAKSDGGCSDHTECADLDGDGRRDEVCMWWECAKGLCEGTPTVFGDLGGPFGECHPDGAVDNNDHFHVLNCFANRNTGSLLGYPCEPAVPAAYNVDAGGPWGNCVPDGTCDGHDVVYVLQSFDGPPPCLCDPPQPEGPVIPEVVAAAGIALQAWPARIAPGGMIRIDAFLDRSLPDLRAYQLHVQTTGGRSGGLELVDIFTDPRRDAAFAGHASWSAFNLGTGQALVGLTSPGISAPAYAYLATFVYRASHDAQGEFLVEIVRGDEPLAGPSYLFPTQFGAQIDLDSAEQTLVVVQSR